MVPAHPHFSVLITGANGFIGRALASSLLAHPALTHLTLTDLSAPSRPSNPPASSSSSSSSSTQISTLALDLTSPADIHTLFTHTPAAPYTHFFLLHGLMSSDSESNLSGSLAVNVDATRLLLDAIRTNDHYKPQPPRVVYTSSCAIYSPLPSNAPIRESTTRPLPSGSYGAQKLMCELLLDDFTRRGLLDAVIVRLPTVIVRAGAPTGAASSFASGMFREPLNGQRCVVPVGREQEVWVTGARVLVRNLERAMSMDAGKSFKRVMEEGKGGGASRVVNLPGRLVTVGEMLEALRAAGGEESVALVDEKVDERTEKIVKGWATRFDTELALGSGFEEVGSLEGIVREFVEDYTGGQRWEGM